MVQNYKTIVAKRLVLAKTYHLSHDMLGLAQSLESEIETLVDEMIIRLRGEVLNTTRTVTVQTRQVPATVWDHVKHDWFPSTLAKWFGVKCTEIREKNVSTFLCPHFYIPGSDKSAHISFLAQGDDALRGASYDQNG